MTSDESRRTFLQLSAAALGVGSLAAIAGCAPPPASEEAAAKPDAMPPSSKGTARVKAAFSNAGLQSTWCAHGIETAKQWGEWIGVDVTVFDSQFSPEKQLRDIEDILSRDFDFVAIQAYAIKTLEGPVRKLIDRGIPVVDMDTRIVPAEEEIGIQTFVTVDHEKIAETATQVMVDAIGGKGKVVHTQGELAHSGAQLRAKGFRNIISKYPDIEVIDEQPGDWDITKVGRIWDDLLVKHPQIDGAFFHSDDMSMAGVEAIKRAGGSRKIAITSIDAQDRGIKGVTDGDLLVSVMNPSGRVHLTSLLVGYFAVTLGESRDAVPDTIGLDGPAVTKENAETFKYLLKHYMI